MGLYKLDYQDTIDNGVLICANPENIDYERSFENWLENSPNIIFEEESNTVIWISRQESAKIGNSVKRPDLLGVDSKGEVVVVELKKGRAPREVIAQILEYSAWVSKFNYDDLNEIYLNYKVAIENVGDDFDTLIDKFRDTFDLDEDDVDKIKFNLNQKLFIFAEDFPDTIIDVVDYLAEKYGIKIKCVQYLVHKTKQGEIFVNTETVAGSERSKVDMKEDGFTERWNEEVKVKDVIYEAVSEYTGGDKNVVFTPKNINDLVAKNYPHINKSTVRCQLIQHCVNHSSRKHYPSGQRDLYYLIEKGKYRLYDKENDGVFDKEVKKITE